MGLNEFAGYGAVALVAWATSNIAATCRLRPYPFMIGIVIVISGTLLSWLFVKDTSGHVNMETQQDYSIPLLKNVFTETSWLNKNLGSLTQAGLINNLNDAMIWGNNACAAGKQRFQYRADRDYHSHLSCHMGIKPVGNR